MATLVERAHELSNQIRSLAGSQATEQEAKAFETRASELSEAASLVFVPARRMESFTAKGIIVEVLTAESSMLKHAVDDMTANYSAEPASILAPDPRWRLVTKSQFNELGKHVTDRLQEAWHAFVLAQLPAIDQGRRNIWRIFPAYQEQERLVEELFAEFDTAAKNLPTSQEELDRPEGLAAELNDIISDLPTELPEPVRDLFQAINQGTATAAHLTDEAVQWLGENELLQTLRISWTSN